MAWLYLFGAATAACFLASRLAPERMTRLAFAFERRRSGLSARSARVGGFDIPYLEGGRGEVLLLIHGFGADKDNFTRIARFLTPHYRVLIPDLPGFGFASRVPGASYAMADQAARLHALLAGLGVERAHLGGNSMGGFIAAQFAADYPQAAASLWLLDAGGTGAAHQTALMRRYAETGENPLLITRQAQFDAMLAAATCKQPFVPGFARIALARRAIADFALHTVIMKQMFASPLLEAQQLRLDMPALVVWGAQDRILSPDAAPELAALFLDAEVRIMDGVGHLPMIEAPRRSAGDYLAWRRRKAGTARSAPAPEAATA